MNDIEKAILELGVQMGHKDRVITDVSCDLAISALEKQIPKKPQEVDVDFSTFVCPNCLSTIMYTDEKETHNYCLKCGQKLDWRVEE